MGLGTAFISERYNIKEAVHPERGGRRGVVDDPDRHRRRPTTTPATRWSPRRYATTMHRLTGGRFTLGLGRGIALLQDVYGIPRITTAQMEDFAGLMRRLWKGETIFGHDGPAGSWPVLRLDPDFDEDIPLALVAFGPELPGPRRPGLRRRDPPHVLHRRDPRSAASRTVKERGRAGRPRPGVGARCGRASPRSATTSPRTCACKKTVGRLATYLQGYGDLLVATNGWDPAPLERFRADDVVGTFAGAHRPDGHHRAARAHRHAHPRRVAGPRGDRHARAVRRRGARASSTSAPTPSSSTAPRRPSWPRSSSAYAAG